MASNLRVVRSDLEQLLRDTTLTTLVFAIALGWSLFQVVSGLGYLIVGAFQKTSPDDLYGGRSVSHWDATYSFFNRSCRAWLS